ncbi:hypothetical protein BH23PAT2_BH23PAT2_02280 [soil metagenome]
MSHEQEPDGLEQLHEFNIYAWERIVDESLPEFKTVRPKSYKIKMDRGEVIAGQENTQIVQYKDKFSFMDHIVVYRGGDEPIYFFQDHDAGPEVKTDYDKLRDEFSGNDFDIVSSPANPSSLVMEEYYSFVRGNEKLETVLERIIDKALADN